MTKIAVVSSHFIINVQTRVASPGQDELTDPQTMDHLARESYIRDILTLETEIKLLRNETDGTSLVAQWLRIRLPTQGTPVQALARKIPPASEQLSQCATTPEPAL